MWYIYTMGYNSTIKSNKIVPFAEKRMDLETVIDSEVRKKKKNYRIINAYTWNLEKWYQ